MESRRIVLLTEGFLRGWLDFDYKTNTSHLREEYVLNALEKSLTSDLLKVKLDTLKFLGQHASDHTGYVNAVTSLEETINSLTLPYVVEKSKISNNTANADTADPEFWRQVLKAEGKKLTKK